MKILRITTVPISLKLLLTGQMKYMRENGYDVIMVSADGPETEEVKAYEGCPHVIIPFTRRISPIADLKSLWLLIKLIRKEKPDIVHTHTPKAGLIGMLAAWFCGVNLKIHTIAGLPLMTATGAKRKLLTFVEKLTYKAADFVLPNSKSILKFVRENKFTSDHKLDMIGDGSSNGIDLGVFSAESIKKEDLEKVKLKINYSAKNTYFLTVGRLVKDKGIVEIVGAFLHLKKSFQNLKLVLLGPLEEEREEENLPPHILKAIKEDESIYHINWSDNVPCYMHLADYLIHASYREGFPNVLLQAGAMKRPIICSNIPGNIDIITDNKTGQYFQVGDMSQLIEKVQYVLKNKTQAMDQAKILRTEIEKKYSRGLFQKKIDAFYKLKQNHNS